MPRKRARTEPEVSLQDRIAARAYALYVERGCVDGHDMEDWLRAEAEVIGVLEGGPSRRAVTDPWWPSISS